VIFAMVISDPSGSVVDLFKDIVNSCSDESTSTTPKSMCTKLLMNTVKRDIPAVEASYKLSRLPLLERTFVPIKLRTFFIITKVSKILKLLTWMD
jgi:hypothetical protein